MVHGQNTTVILYKITNGASPGVLRLIPMVNCRGYHFITYADQINFTQNRINGGVSVKGREEVPPLLLTVSDGAYNPGGNWFKGMAYLEEKERGENCFEDHYIPGFFEVSLAAGENKTVAVIASTVELDNPDGEKLLERARGRQRELENLAGYDETLARRLVRAADAFIVRRRSTGAKTVIAGYPWFTDWGRDTMIALPGLTLVTKRFNDARDILLTYARQCKKGLLPNCFPDGDEAPLYNTVDASLWYFQAVYKYLVYTGDLEFIHEQIYPVLKEIIHWYINGTDYNIFMDEDGLLNAGTPDVQLTWMDAKVDGWVVTPRNGKPVEVNALWYNALCVLEILAGVYGERLAFQDLTARIKSSFTTSFWSEKEGYLCDVISPEGKDWKVRPNQLLAVSLPYSMLSGEQARRVVHKVWRELYVAYGIRSLSPECGEYKGVYTGDRVQRDGSYHQGTAWSWLMGPFVTAYRKSYNYSAASREQAYRFLEPFRNHLRDRGVGQVSEIFDGNEPVAPKGCFAQAWGGAEVLRAYVEDVLEIRPPALEKIEALIRG
ncbi:MAG: Amylo-alpha-1,6-glucosidase [Pelotomaculum sp. PtaB.Bin013]|nr:MAG: Amylo-alpha-1,6-glucosidase [Pelotomaculum sp. PtaB.Bin013]